MAVVVAIVAVVGCYIGERGRRPSSLSLKANRQKLGKKNCWGGVRNYAYGRMTNKGKKKAETVLDLYRVLLLHSFNFFRPYLHFSSLVTPFHSTCEWIYQPRLEKSSKISLVVSSLDLNLIPKILACLELSYLIIYIGSPSTWVISGNPSWNLWEGSGEGERELAASTMF